MRDERRESGHPKSRRRLPLWLKALGGAALGGALGLGVYLIIGCPTGYCPITSNWLVTTAYGSVLGAIIGLSG